MKNKIDLTDTKMLQGNWNFPTSIRFGVGKINELSELCKKGNILRPLLVTDSGLVKLPFVNEIVEQLQSNDLPVVIFSEVKPNPTGSNITSGVEYYKKGKHDGVIALGGGSALDAAKAIALMVGQDRPLWDYEDIGDNWLRVNAETMSPTIAIPTTAGTGSEVGRASVIVDEKKHAKKIIFHPNMMPFTVIADPQLTQGLPPHITAATGVDAFVHNLEAYCAPGYHPMADGIAIEGMRLIKQWLPIAFKNGNDLTARSHMLIASSMGATAFQKGLGAVHALAHPLGALYDAHHGLLNAILLPYVLLKNKPEIEQRLIHLTHCLEIEDKSFNGFFNWILSFRKELKIPKTLSEIGINNQDKEKIGLLATKDAAAASNPILYDQHQYSEIFADAVAGTGTGATKKN